MADKMITMCHPNVEGTAETTEEAFVKVYKRKGWQIAPPPEPPELEKSDFVDPEASGFESPPQEPKGESPEAPGWETSEDNDED